MRQLEEGELIPIPPHLKPNSKEVMYFFDLDAHLLFFDVGALAHQWTKDFFTKAVGIKTIVDKFGIVEIETLSSSEPIDNILKMPKLTKLAISLSPPNGDDPNQLMQEIKKRLEDQNVRRYEQKFIAPNKKGMEGIKPDDITRAHMQLATTDGYVWAEGRDADNLKIVESTVNHPLELTQEYDEKLDNRAAVLQSIAERAVYDKFKETD